MPNMRVTSYAHGRIRAIAEDRHVSMQDALDLALRDLEQASFWVQTYEAFVDPDFVREYRDERRELDGFHTNLPEDHYSSGAKGPPGGTDAAR